MQGQYGSKEDKRLRDIAKEMWREWGFRRGVMRGYWVNPDYIAYHHLVLTTSIRSPLQERYRLTPGMLQLTHLLPDTLIHAKIGSIQHLNSPSGNLPPNTDRIFLSGRCLLVVQLEVYVFHTVQVLINLSSSLLSQIAYWLSCYPLGMRWNKD